MNMVANQIMRRGWREAFKLVIRIDVMSLSKGYGRIFPDTFTNLSLPFKVSGWRSEGHYLKGRHRRRQGTKER